MHNLLMTATSAVSAVIVVLGILSLLFKDEQPSISETIVTMFIAVSISTTILCVCNATSTHSSEIKEALSKSDIGWHTVYKNDISASIKIYQDSIIGERILDPEKKVTSKEINQFFDKRKDTSEAAIVATNAIDSTRKAVIMSKKNIIEKWPK